jgi:hypothetical protein
VGYIRLLRLRGLEEVVQAGDAEDGVVDAVTLQTAVAQNVPGLHAGEDVLDGGANLLVRAVVILFP